MFEWIQLAPQSRDIVIRAQTQAPWMVPRRPGLDRAVLGATRGCVAQLSMLLALEGEAGSVIQWGDEEVFASLVPFL